MGEIIQYEGVAYKLVNRKAQEGDVVIARVSDNSGMEVGQPYKVKGNYGSCAVDVGGYQVKVYARAVGRTEATVDVYEKVDEHARQVNHLDHPFYKEARDLWQITQHGQIKKGAEKYPEPFTPTNWTVWQLLEHGMQENVDQAHYLYGLYVKVQEMEKELQELREFRDNVQKTVVKWGAMNEPKDRNA